jgi:hypothetical protein
MGNEKDGLERHEQIAERLYDRNAATPLPPPEKGDFYSWTPEGAVLDQRGPELFAEAGIDSAAQRQLRDTHRGIRRATGLPDGLIGQIVEGHLDNLLAEARVSEDPDGDAIALDRQIAASNAELRQEFAQRYGAKDGEALLERTRRFVRGHPALAKILQQRGLGSRPEIVRGIAAHIFSTGWH